MIYVACPDCEANEAHGMRCRTCGGDSYVMSFRPAPGRSNHTALRDAAQLATAQAKPGRNTDVTATKKHRTESKSVRCNVP